MMKKKFFSVMLILLVSAINAQIPRRHYRLETIIDSALRHYAINGQAAIQQQIFELQSSIINNGWKPQLMLNGQASYQSDVTRVEIPIPGFYSPEIAKDWYKLNLDITQQIYDGGISAERKKAEEASLAVSLKNIDQKCYHFREQIHNIYFHALLYEQQINDQQSAVNSLEKLINEMQSAYETGMILQSELNTLKVEKLKLLQQKTTSEAGRKSALALLATHSGLPISADDSLLVPNQNIGELKLVNQRPELERFTLQQEQLQQQESLSKTTRNPVIQAFGQAGYGRPCFNMLEDDFTPYAIAGIRFQYRIYDWKSNQKERKIIRLNAQTLDLAKQDFEQNISATAKAKLEEIKQYEVLLAQGREIIGMQKEILQTAENQLKNSQADQARIHQLFEKNAANSKQKDDIDGAVALNKTQQQALIAQFGGIEKETQVVDAQIAQLNDNIRKAKIVQPINGTILAKYAEACEIAAPGKPLYKTADLNHLDLKAYITGKQLADFVLGKQVNVFIDGTNEATELKGTISWIASSAEFTPKTIQTKEERTDLVYAIKVRVGNDGRLKIGMPCEIRLITH